MIRLLSGICMVCLFVASCQAVPPGTVGPDVPPGTGGSGITGGPGPISDPELRPLSMVFQENQADPHISIFSKAVIRADLTSLLSEPVSAGEHGEEGAYTAFVPSDAAFNAYLQQQGVSEQAFLDRPDLATFVKAHLVEDVAAGKVLASKSAEAMTFETLNEKRLTLHMEGEGCFAEPPRPRDCTFVVNGTARSDEELTYQQQYQATNGELLVIDEVLTP